MTCEQSVHVNNLAELTDASRVAQAVTDAAAPVLSGSELFQGAARR